MHNRVLLALAVASALPGAGIAQQARVYSEPGRALTYSFSTNDDPDRAVIGITQGSSGSARDTLGVLISAIAPGGPAEKAGLEEGTRIASVNGVNLRLAAADVGDYDMAGAMSRRLSRELGKLKAGDEVDLRVYSGGQFRNVKLKTVTSESLYRSNRTAQRRDDDDERAAIGVSLGSSGSKRDTLGVLVTWLDDNGPAAKAGLEEGNRIAGIGAVDLRVSREDAGDEMIGQVKAQRLQRELEKLKPGDEVELRVYSDGRTRSVKLKTVAASSLSRGGRGGFSIFGTTPRAMVAPRIVTPAPGGLPAIRFNRITM